MSIETVSYRVHGRRVPVEITPHPDDSGALAVYASGFFVDAIYPCPFGGYRPYANGQPLFPGRRASETVPQAIQSALEW